MSFNDPISDLLTRIRNAAQAKHDDVMIPYSRLKESMLRVLHRENFLSGIEVVGEGVRKQIVVQLRYHSNRKPMMINLRRISKPGRRVYIQSDDIQPSRQGMGISLLSTPKGILTDKEATEAHVGGELLCTIW